MLGWDEILRPDLPHSIVIQSWRGPDSLAQAAKLGYRGLLSSGYYVDLNWSAERHYLNEPISGAAANLTPEEQKRILGGEACMWAEYVSPESIDSRIWPRTAAIAERLWSPQDVRDVNSMYQRMESESQRLEWLGLTHNSSYEAMLRRITGGEDISSLKVLADVSEPVKDYSREELATEPPTSLKPLNRVVDAVRPESATGRQFAAAVDSIVAGSAKPGSEPEVGPCCSAGATIRSSFNRCSRRSFCSRKWRRYRKISRPSAPPDSPLSTIWIAANMLPPIG